MGILDDVLEGVNKPPEEPKKEETPPGTQEGADGKPTHKRMFDYGDDFRVEEEKRRKEQGLDSTI